jgi:hypothetical protein
MNDEFEKMWEEAVVDALKLLFGYLSGGVEVLRC